VKILEGLDQYLHLERKADIGSSRGIRNVKVTIRVERFCHEFEKPLGEKIKWK
jgi:hypothetical protein